MMPNGMKHMLPESFSPSELDFVIGRGKKIKAHSGNQRLYNQIRCIADDYTSGDKAQKSFLLSQLVRQVYQHSPEAGFVKLDPTSGRWYAVEDALARTSAAQAVRDCLHNHYKSSRQFKQQRRRLAKQGGGESSESLPSLASPAPQQSAHSMMAMSRRSITPDYSNFTYNSVKSTLNLNNGGNDMFSILASAFAANSAAMTMEDPFEPVPIAETPARRMQTVMDCIDTALEVMPEPLTFEEDMDSLFQF